MSKKKNEPELLKLFNSREAWKQHQHRKPEANDAFWGKVRAAGLAHAKANKADSFAYNYIVKQMLMGYDSPEDVLSDATGRLRAN